MLFQTRMAAVMCFHPDPEKWFTCAYIKIGFFADNDADILYQDEIHRSLITQVEKTMDLIYTKYMKAFISYDGIHRKETCVFQGGLCRKGLVVECPPSKQYLDAEKKQGKIVADVGKELRQDGTINDTINGTINGKISVSKSERLVFAEIKKNLDITMDSIVVNTGLSRRTVARAIKSLSDKNIINRAGSRKTGHWEIVEDD